MTLLFKVLEAKCVQVSYAVLQQLLFPDVARILMRIFCDLKVVYFDIVCWNMIKYCEIKHSQIVS